MEPDKHARAVSDTQSIHDLRNGEQIRNHIISEHAVTLFETKVPRAKTPCLECTSESVGIEPL